jgi:hypothetical protein
MSSKILWTLAFSAIALLALYFFTDIRWKNTSVEVQKQSWESGIAEGKRDNQSDIRRRVTQQTILSIFIFHLKPTPWKTIQIFYKQPV